MAKKRSYPQKLFLSYSSALLLFMTVLFLFISLYISGQEYLKSRETQMQLVSKTMEQIDFSLQTMDRILQGLLADDEFMEIMTSPHTEQEYSDFLVRFKAKAHTLDAPLFTTYRILAFNQDVVYSHSGSSSAEPPNQDKLLHYPWANIINLANGDSVFLPPHSDILTEQKPSIYSVARAIVKDGKVHGIVEVQHEFSELQYYCDIRSSFGKIAVFAPNGNIAFPLDRRENRNFLHNIFSIVERSGQSGTLNFRFARPYDVVVNGPKAGFSRNGYNAQISYCKSDYSQWTTVMYCPRSALFQVAFPIIILAIVVFLTTVILSLLMLHRLTAKLTAPLIDLNKAVSKVSLENFSLQLSPSCEIVEIENINQSFQKMFQDLKAAIAQTVEARAGEERANYLALEAQMNPHTLYNTITMIESVSYMNGDTEVSNLCIALTHMLRYLSDYTEHPYTIADELEYLTCYRTLVEKRYEDQLTIRISVDPSLRDQAIPKYTIQPLVENSVKHGMCDACQLLIIDVTVERLTGGWRLAVCDNGRGFDEESRKAVLEQFAQCDKNLQASTDVINHQIGNLALSNIYIRWRICFGEKFSIFLANREGATGSRIELFVSD